MRLSKKWHGIPAAVLVAVLALVLLTGSAFAAYTFLGFTTTVTVAEPLAVEYNLRGNYGGDSAWHPLGDTDSLTIDGSAGDVFNIDLRINNRADTALTISTAVTGQIAHFTFSGFPNGTIPKSDGNDANPEWSGTATIGINGDAPVSTTGYLVNFAFKRS